jgi:pyridoxal phosphate enzyme (YggS family)
VESLADRLARVDAGVAEALRAAGRPADDVHRIVVTKFHPAELVRQLLALGVSEFGESRHQEAQAKAAELAGPQPTSSRPEAQPSVAPPIWHFVGQLQSNKARQVRAYASAVHSLDRASVVDALASGGPAVDGFIQINLTDDASRGGVGPDDVESLAERVHRADGIRLAGLMCVAPLGGDPRGAFARVRELSERVRRIAPGATGLSMGMSGDYREAIAEGATHLRIGTAITGNRPAPR